MACFNIIQLKEDFKKSATNLGFWPKLGEGVRRQGCKKIGTTVAAVLRKVSVQ